jgi:ArsR family transcriptional regulator, arsenate/arsenite/antimonite-responsive transcriptional repressor
MREWRELRLYFRALADVRRLRMVTILASTGEVGVKELCVRLRASQPLVSWHLRVLKRCGLVTTRRQGRQVFCSLNRQAFAAYQVRLAHVIDSPSLEGDGVGRDETGQLPASQPPITAGL